MKSNPQDASNVARLYPRVIKWTQGKIVTYSYLMAEWSQVSEILCSNGKELWNTHKSFDNLNMPFTALRTGVSYMFV
jgi:hypothetical protein